MAWTTPATVQVAQMIDDDWMNEQVRDNLSAVGANAHSGAGGDGSATLEGIDSITHDDIADPSAPGTDKTIIWTNTGKLHMRAGAAGSAQEFSVVGHTH